MSTQKKKASSALALPTMAPPVKKSEVIEALYLLALEQFTQKERQNSLNRAELVLQWEEGLQPLLANPRSIQFGKPSNWENHSVSISVKLTPQLKQIGNQWSKIAPQTWNEKTERQRIAEKMANAGSRAKDLLADPASKAALEKMLAQIDG